MNNWHRQDTKEHICIWSDAWIENYHRERLNPEDAKSVCDSPDSENKKSPRDMQK